MQQDGKNKPQEQELDRFWDISSLMPKSRRGQGIRRPESVEAVEVCSEESVGTPNDSNRLTSHPDASRLSARPLDRSSVTADRFDPEIKVPEPELEYVPDNALIHRVRVFEKSGQYNYYEQFWGHANRIGGLKGKKCEFVTFFSYVPQFSQLTKPQLDWYLWWRECVLQGTYMPTDFSYILL